MALGGLLGGGGKSAPQVNYTPPGFNAGGLSATFGGNSYSVTPGSDRTAAVGGLANTFNQQGNAYGDLLKTVQPGFSDLRNAQMQNLQNQRTSALGNLQQNLARRRVLGSSFGQDAATRANLDYNQQQAQVQAQTYLQELQSSTQLTQQQFAAYQSSFSTTLNEMNLEAQVASDLTNKASSNLLSAAQTQAQLDAQNAAGVGKFFGSIGQMLGSGLSGMFGGSGGASSVGSGLAAASSFL